MSSTIPRSRSVSLAACGVVAPFVYAAGAIAASLTYPGYHHLKNAISELGATGAPSATIMNVAGFLPYGALMVVFALAVHRGIRADAGGWLGPSVLAVYGLGYIALAFAQCDPGCQAATPSLHHRMHLLLGDVIFLAAVLGPFTLYPRMVRDPAWRSLATATLVLPASAWLISELSGIGMSGALRQRLWLLLLFLWIGMMALRLLGFAAATDQKPAPQAAA